MPKATHLLAGFVMWAWAIPCLAEVPELAPGRAVIGQEAPMWVSADVALVEHVLQRQHFHPDILPRLEHHLQLARTSNANGCEVFTEPSRGGHQEGIFKGNTPGTISARSAQVLTGEVTDLKSGFLYGRPGSLVEVRLDPAADAGDPVHVYLFLHVAELLVEGAWLCTGIVEGRAVPAVGASVVLALDEKLEGERVLGEAPGGPIVEPRPNEVLIQGAPPRSYRPDNLDVEEIRARLRPRGSRPADETSTEIC